MLTQPGLSPKSSTSCSALSSAISSPVVAPFPDYVDLTRQVNEFCFHGILGSQR